jgi:hypothetical protein
MLGEVTEVTLIKNHMDSYLHMVLCPSYIAYTDNPNARACKIITFDRETLAQLAAWINSPEQDIGLRLSNSLPVRDSLPLGQLPP